jgi:dienelactone hydrolase
MLRKITHADQTARPVTVQSSSARVTSAWSTRRCRLHNEIYPGAIHGFTMSDTDAFNPSALQRHWDRLLPLLDRTLINS